MRNRAAALHDYGFQSTERSSQVFFPYTPCTYKGSLSAQLGSESTTDLHYSGQIGGKNIRNLTSFITITVVQFIYDGYKIVRFLVCPEGQ